MTGIIGDPIPKWSEKRGAGASDVVPFPNTPIYHIVGFSIVLKLFPHMIYWLVVWNMFIFPYMGIIIPTDELIFFRGKPPSSNDIMVGSLYHFIPIIFFRNSNDLTAMSL